MKIRESNTGAPKSIDRESKVIRGVKICGSDSKNGRQYSQQALTEAAALYEGCEVNCDHPELERSDEPRKLADNFGYLRGVKVQEGAVFGDLHYIESHPLSGAILERAERFPDKFGLSHNADGVVTAGDDGIAIVESISSVHSVDIVSRPATNAGLFEHAQPKGRKMKVRELLTRHRSHPYAKAMLEMEDEAAVAEVMDAEVPAEVAAAEESAAPPSDEEAVKAAFKASIIAAVDDPVLDLKATVAKIKEILAAQEKVAGPVGGEAPADDAPATPAAEGGDSEEVKEEIRSMRAELAKMKRDNDIRALLEEFGCQPSDTVVRILERCESPKEMREVLGEMSPAQLGMQKPAISRLHESGGSAPNYGESMKSIAESGGNRVITRNG